MGQCGSRWYDHSVNSTYDLLLHMAIRHGKYRVTVYGEPGCSTYNRNNQPRTNIWDMEVQGAIVAAYKDAFALAGSPYKGYAIL